MMAGVQEKVPSWTVDIRPPISPANDHCLCLAELAGLIHPWPTQLVWPFLSQVSINIFYFSIIFLNFF